jgi:hypothetical protein
MKKIRHLRALFPVFRFWSIPENPDNSFFSNCKENIPEYRSVCQNKGGNNLTQSPPKALKPSQKKPLGLLHPGAVNPAGMRI